MDNIEETVSGIETLEQKADTPKKTKKVKEETTSSPGISSASLEALQKARAEIEKKYGKGTLIDLKGGTVGGVEFISTNIIGFDEALGGGFAKGRIIEIFGPESSGKTTIAIHAMAQSQKEGGHALFVDAEHAADLFYAQDIGLDLSPEKFTYSQPDSGEQALEIASNLIESGGISIAVIDSVSALTPQAEIDGEIGDSHVGLQARMMSQAMRKLVSVASRNNCSLIFTNQIRMKIGVMFGSPECVTPDTLVTIHNVSSGIIKDVTMEKLFNIFGYDYKDMKIGSFYYTSKNSDVRIRSFNHETKKIEYKRIVSIIHKESVDTVYSFYTKDNKLKFSCSPAHKVFYPVVNKYVTVSEFVDSTEINLFDGKDFVTGYFKIEDRVEDILDIQVEDNHNYFTNGVLSHNTTSGGQALKFAASQRLDVRKVETQNANGKDEDATANLIRVKLIKNKVAPPFRKVEMILNFGKGLDVVHDLLEQAVKHGVVDKSGSWYSYGEERIGQGSNNVQEYLKSNPATYQEIYKKVKEAITAKKLANQ